MCQLREAPEPARAVSQGLSQVLGLTSTMQKGPGVNLLLCRNGCAQMRENHLLPSLVLCFLTLLSVQVCLVFGMPHCNFE